MKNLSKIYGQLLLLMVAPLVLFGLIGCTNDFEEIEGMHPSASKMVKRELVLTDPQDGSRAVNTDFPDNAELYVAFYAERTYKWSKAVYSEQERKWTIEFPEEILAYDKGVCQVAYANQGKINVSSYNLFVETNTSLMVDDSGVWNNYGDVIAVRAHLEPVFSKIRFVSDSPTEIWVKGVGLPYTYYNSESKPITSADYKYQKSLPCYPKIISVKDKGADGRYYSDYLYTHTNRCEYNHTNGTPGTIYFNCTESEKLSIYYPTETSSYYTKTIEEYKPGESYLVKLPTSGNYSGWSKQNNKIQTISSEIKLGYVSGSVDDYKWEPNYMIYGQFINFEFSTNSSDGSVSVTGTQMSCSLDELKSGGKYSLLYADQYWLGRVYFRFNVLQMSKYYVDFKNVTLTQFPIYDVFEGQ